MNTVRRHCNVVKYTTLNKAIQWLRKNMDHIWNSQKAFHIWPSQASYAVLLQGFLDSFNRVVGTTLHCIRFSCIQMQLIAQQENPQAELTPLNMYNKFVERIRRHLHVVLAFSPIGDAFRNRLRMFPSLINCCTIDWFKVGLPLLT